MEDKDIYKLTPRGEQELRGSMTTLSPSEIELLIRIDGILAFAQIKAGMPSPQLSSVCWTGARLLSVAEADALMHAVRTVVGLPEAASAPNDLWVDKQAR